MSVMPSTIEMPIFWVSGALLIISLHIGVGPYSRGKKGRGFSRVKVRVALLLGIVILPFLFYPLSRWDPSDTVFGQLFSWYCAHGMIAIMFMRMDSELWSRLKKRREILAGGGPKTVNL